MTSASLLDIPRPAGTRAAKRAAEIKQERETMRPAENVHTEIKDNQLIITVKLDGITKTPSASGKSMLIATTSGNIRITPSITLGLNVYEPNK